MQHRDIVWYIVCTSLALANRLLFMEKGVTNIAHLKPAMCDYSDSRRKYPLPQNLPAAFIFDVEEQIHRLIPSDEKDQRPKHRIPLAPRHAWLRQELQKDGRCPVLGMLIIEIFADGFGVRMI